MIISLAPGETLTVNFHDSYDKSTGEVDFLDGSFKISFAAASQTSSGVIRIEADTPDSMGRSGIIYEEGFVMYDKDGDPIPKDIADEQGPIPL